MSHTDVFAHRSGIDVDGDGVYKSYGHTECDVMKNYPKRGECSLMVTESIITRFLDEKKSSLWEFYMGYRCWAGKEFRIAKMLEYAKQIKKNLDPNLEYDFKYISF